MGSKSFLKLTFGVYSLLAGTMAFAEKPYSLEGAKSFRGDLKVKKSQVPQYDLVRAKTTSIKNQGRTIKIKILPELDLGVEPTLKDSGANLNLPPTIANKPTIVKSQPLPDLISTSKKKNQSNTIEKATEAKDITKNIAKPEPKVLKVPEYPPLVIENIKEPNLNTIAIRPFSDSEIRLLQAMIFLDLHKNFELSLGLLAELLNNSDFKWEATYLYGRTAQGLKLYSESEMHLLKILNQNHKELSPKALEEILKNMTSTESALALKLESSVKKYDPNDQYIGAYSVAHAKNSIDNGKLSVALQDVEGIPKESPFFNEGQFLKGLILYRSGNIDEALEIMNSTLEAVTQSSHQWDLKSLAAMTVARIYFQKGEFKKAFESYLKVEKNHPLWLQSLIETAWTQILTKDYEGAAGNMFSLHTDFFKNAYQPESYVVRTVSYLNLCQFGDSLAVLKEFKRKYSFVQSRVQDYMKSHKSNLDYYETVKSFLKEPNQREVDALPRSLVVEMARHPEFLQEQRNINELEDEAIRYVAVSKTLLEKEKKYQTNIKETKAKIVELQNKLTKTTHPDAKIKITTSIADNKKLQLAYEIQYEVAKRARNSIKQVREVALDRIEKSKGEIRKVASQMLKHRLENVDKQLKTLIDQGDVLQYEIFSGAGEHIRYQMAGGEVNEEARPELKPEGDKSQTWGFKGEIWEDEVGHYRSSLKNVCPKDETVTAN